MKRLSLREKRKRGRKALARWKANNPEGARRSILTTFLKKQYGVTYEWYMDLLRTQDGLCAVCRQPETVVRRNGPQRLAIDHDHETQQIRGLLCAGCNMALGLLGEDVLRMRALIAYVERHRIGYGRPPLTTV